MSDGYDVIIVGAGSAGAVLANRLSEDGSRRVCVIEAGPPDTHAFIHMPFGLALLSKAKGLNWGYETAPEPRLDGRRLYWPRGRTLGGSSSINAMIYMRGHPADYEGWAAAAGPRWGWARARALFRRMEGNRALADDHHGTDGPLTVDTLRSVNPLSRAFVAAGRDLQFPENPDFNGARQDGVGFYQVTQSGGRRFSAARAFLDPARSRPNLTIETGAHVERVVFEDRRAVGVALRERTLRLNPGGEVILSGGAINSPQLLMLSCVGPAAMLRAQGIAPLHDLPEVGRNLADHLDVSLLATERGRLSMAVSARFLPRALRALWAYWRRGEGEFTTNIAEAGGFLRSDPDRDRPNLQFHFLPVYLLDHGRKTSFVHGMTLHVCDLLPKSRGEITLASPDPMAAPRIAPNYLDHPDDLDTLLKAMKIGRRFMSAPSLAAHVAAERAPGPEAQTDDALIADIRARAETIYHPVGTCRMGSDAASVVDPEGRVRGVDGLRVVDASIMPSIIAGNTNAPTMMIAENVADMMLGRAD